MVIFNCCAGHGFRHIEKTEEDSMKKIFSVAIMMVMVLTAAGIVQGKGNVVADGKTVKIHYTLTVNGEVVDTTIGKEPLEYVQGTEMIIPSLEKQLLGLAVGKKKSVRVTADQAYGLRNEQAVMEIPKSNFSPDQELEVGMMLHIPTETGTPMIATVEAVNAETVLLDFNHPLAGKTLYFDVEIVDVK